MPRKKKLPYKEMYENEVKDHAITSEKVKNVIRNHEDTLKDFKACSRAFGDITKKNNKLKKTLGVLRWQLGLIKSISSKEEIEKGQVESVSMVYSFPTEKAPCKRI